MQRSGFDIYLGAKVRRLNFGDSSKKHSLKTFMSKKNLSILRNVLDADGVFILSPILPPCVKEPASQWNTLRAEDRDKSAYGNVK